jgi:hypothetical protein
MPPVLEKRSASPSTLKVEKDAVGEWRLSEGERWIGTQFWLVRKERFERLPAAICKIEGRLPRLDPKLIDKAAESVLSSAFAKRQPFTLGELVWSNGDHGTPCHALLGHDGEMLPFRLNADFAAVLEKATPDCEWLENGRGGALRADGKVPWAVVMMMRIQ